MQKNAAFLEGHGENAIIAAIIGCFLWILPSFALGCACGCDVFSVGEGHFLPQGEHGSVFVEYDYMNQNQNWHKTSKASADENDDKKITTNFFTLGGQYNVSRDWTLSAELPIWNRQFTTNGDEGLETYKHEALGDIRLTATYTGLSPNKDFGLVLGLKLPTGDHKYSGLDPDTQISTGATDLILGGYQQLRLDRNGDIIGFAHVLWDKPIASRAAYRPGEEWDAAIGLSWTLIRPNLSHPGFAPLIQVVESVRTRDHGSEGDPDNSGFERLLLAPGIESHWKDWHLLADVRIPVSQRVNGDQLVAPALFKVMIRRSF